MNFNICCEKFEHTCIKSLISWDLATQGREVVAVGSIAPGSIKKQ